MAAPIVAGVSAAYTALPANAKTKALQWVKKATNGAIQSVDALKQYATKGDAQAAVVAEGFVRAGAPVDEVSAWFNTGANAAQIRASLIRLGQSLNLTVEAHRPGVQGSSSDTSSDALRLRLVRSLVRAFGSVENARTVQLALDSLKSADFDWYETMATQFGRN